MPDKEMSTEEWKKALIEFYGSTFPTIGTSQKSADECIGFARELLTGSDPYKNERKNSTYYKDIRINEYFKFRKGDKLPYLYLKYNLLRLSPDEMRLYENTPGGKFLLDELFEEFIK